MIFAIMTWLGVVIALLGLGGLIWCMRRARWIKRTELSAPELHAVLRKLVFVNMASIGVAFLGLCLMILGQILGS